MTKNAYMRHKNVRNVNVLCIDLLYVCDRNITNEIY